MADRKIPEDIQVRLKPDRDLIAQELPELMQRDARMSEAAAENTLCGHLRRAIHESRRPLGDLAHEAGIATTVLCDFLEGERTLRSDVLDRLTQALGVSVSIAPD